MRISILPETALGKWSVILLLVFVLSWVLAAGFSALAGLELLGPGYNPVVAGIVTVFMVAMSGAAFVTGAISITRDMERAVLVYLSAGTGFWGLIIWLLGVFSG
jgi:hypothetical protein